MTDTPAHVSSPRPASPSAEAASPAPAAADESAPLLVSSTEAADDDVPQAPTRSRLIYVMTVASLGFTVDFFILGIATWIVSSVTSQHLWYYIADRLREVAVVAVFSLLISAINLARMRENRPLMPLAVNLIFDLAISFYMISLASPQISEVIDYTWCNYGEGDPDGCRRRMLPIRILAGLMLGAAVVVGVIHSILFVIRCRDAYRTKFWRQPWHFPTGEYTLQFTVKLAKQPQREEGTV